MWHADKTPRDESLCAGERTICIDLDNINGVRICETANEKFIVIVIVA